MNKPVSRRTSKSDLARVDAHRIARGEYEELPELTDEMLARAVVNKGGRPRSASPRQLISLRLPAEVVAKWRATGPGWQTRMAERLSTARLKPRASRETYPPIERTFQRPLRAFGPPLTSHYKGFPASQAMASPVALSVRRSIASGVPSA